MQAANSGADPDPGGRASRRHVSEGRGEALRLRPPVRELCNVGFYYCRVRVIAHGRLISPPHPHPTPLQPAHTHKYARTNTHTHTHLVFHLAYPCHYPAADVTRAIKPLHCPAVRLNRSAVQSDQDVSCLPGAEAGDSRIHLSDRVGGAS